MKIYLIRYVSEYLFRGKKKKERMFSLFLLQKKCHVAKRKRVSKKQGFKIETERKKKTQYQRAQDNLSLWAIWPLTVRPNMSSLYVGPSTQSSCLTRLLSKVRASGWAGTSSKLCTSVIGGYGNDCTNWQAQAMIGSRRYCWRQNLGISLVSYHHPISIPCI